MGCIGGYMQWSNSIKSSTFFSGNSTSFMSFCLNMARNIARKIGDHWAKTSLCTYNLWPSTNSVTLESSSSTKKSMKSPSITDAGQIQRNRTLKSCLWILNNWQPAGPKFYQSNINRRCLASYNQLLAIQSYQTDYNKALFHMLRCAKDARKKLSTHVDIRQSQTQTKSMFVHLQTDKHNSVHNETKLPTSHSLHLIKGSPTGGHVMFTNNVRVPLNDVILH